MSSIPLVASAADVPRAVRYAERNPSARWYVARRAASLGCPEAVPAEWLEAAGASPLTAASGKAKKPVTVLAKVIDAAWDAALHPRGRDGKFIEKGGAVDVVVPGWPKTRGTAVGVRKNAWGDEVLTISFEPDVYKQLQDAGHLPSEPYMKDESRVQLAPKWVEAAPDQKADLPGGPEPVDVGDEVADPAETVGELEKGWVVQLVVEGELVNDHDEALSALLAVFPDVDQADLGDVTPVDGRPGHWRTAIPGEVALRARNDGEFADSAEIVSAEDGDEFVDQVSIVVNALDAPDLAGQEQLEIDEQLQGVEDQEFDDLYWSSEVIMADLDADGEGTLVEDLQKALDERIGEIKKIDDLEERDRVADMLRDAMDDIAGHSLGEAPEGASDEDIADLEDQKAEVLHAAHKALDEVSTPPGPSPTPVDEPAAAEPELTGYQKAFRKSFADEIRGYGYDALDDEDDDEELSSQIESLAQGIESGEFVSPEDALDQLDMLGVLNSEDREDIWRSAHLAGNQATYGPDDIDRMLDDTIEAIYGDADDWDDPDVAYPGSLDREGKLDALVNDVGDWDSAEDRGMALAAIAWAEDASTADDTPEPELIEDLPLLLLNGEPDDIMEAYAGADSNLLSDIATDFEQAGIDHPDRAGDLADQLEKVIEREAEAWSYTGSPADLGVDEADWDDYVADRDAAIVEANMTVSKLRGEKFDPDSYDAAPAPTSTQSFGTYDPKYDHLREAWYGTILDADGNQLDPEEFEAAAAALGIRNPQFSPDGGGMLMELSDERLDQLANDGAIDVEAGGYRLEVEGFDSDDLAAQLADLGETDVPVPDSDAPAAPDTSGDYTPGADTPQAKLIYAGLYSSASNKGIDVVDAGIDERLDALLLNPDREAAHKDLAAIMTQLKLGGKQRKRYREMLDEHFGVDPDDSGSGLTVAKSVSDGLAPDNPLKAKLDAKIKELEAPLEADQAGAPEPGVPEVDVAAPKTTRVKGFTKAQTINMREYYSEGGPGHASAEELGFDPATIGETYIDVVDLDRAIEKLSADYADSTKWMKRNTPYKQYKALREQGLGLPGERQSVNNVRRRLERMRKEQGGAPKTSVPVATSTNVGPTAVDAGVAIKDLSDVDLVGRYKVDLADGVDVKDVRRELVRRNISVKDAGEGLLVKKTTAPSTIADVESIAKTAGDDSVRLMAAVDTLREARANDGIGGDDTPSGKVLLAMARALNDNYVTKADGPLPLPPAYAKIYADELRPYDYEPGVAALVTALDKVASGGPPGKA